MTLDRTPNGTALTPVEAASPLVWELSLRAHRGGRAGRRACDPSAEIDEACRAWVMARWPAAATVLAATETSLGNWDIREMEEQGEAIYGIIMAGQVGTLHMLLDQRDGRIQDAVRTCQDVLALGRDAGGFPHRRPRRAIPL